MHPAYRGTSLEYESGRYDLPRIAGFGANWGIAMLAVLPYGLPLWNCHGSTVLFDGSSGVESKG